MTILCCEKRISNPLEMNKDLNPMNRKMLVEWKDKNPVLRLKVDAHLKPADREVGEFELYEFKEGKFDTKNVEDSISKPVVQLSRRLFREEKKQSKVQQQRRARIALLRSEARKKVPEMDTVFKIVMDSCDFLEFRPNKIQKKPKTKCVIL